MSTYSSAEIKIFRKLKTPKKVQDFLECLKINFEERGDTVMSPRMVLRTRKAHCMEGAMFAAAALEFHGHKPLVIDLRSIKPGDDDHVVAVFRQFGCWGGISKTNHAVLRYREPVYKTIRELVLSYFHEYFLDSGKKTLREYSLPLDLRYFDRHPIFSNQPVSRSSTPLFEKKRRTALNWRTSEEDMFEIPERLDKITHYNILSAAQIKNLRKADVLEIKAGKLVDWNI